MKKKNKEEKMKIVFANGATIEFVGKSDEHFVGTTFEFLGWVNYIDDEVEDKSPPNENSE